MWCYLDVCYKWTSEITFTEEKMKYSYIQEFYVLIWSPQLKEMGLKKYIFKYNNDSKHSSKHAEEYLNNKNIDLMI